MSIYINNNHGTVYNECTVTIQNGQVTVQEAEENVTPAEPTESKEILPIPGENKYTQVREYIRERSRFDAEFKTFVQERSLRDLCTRLTKEFGWFVDEHSLGSNLNRHRKD